jgi:signal transduction histidine kinase
VSAIEEARDPTRGGAVTLEQRIIRPCGEVRHLAVKAQTYFDDDSAHARPLRTLGTLFDITERKRVEAQRDALALRVLEVQEDERRAVARDLHDEIGQALAALKLNLLSLRRNSGVPPNTVHDSLRITDEVLRQVRELALSLRPSVLDDLGLGAAVHWYVEHTASRAGVEATCRVQPDLPTPCPAVEIACFRILQEALTNVYRHARASRVEVSLRRTPGGLELLVKDDGCGFAVDSVLGNAADRYSRMGLLGMRERTLLLGGQADVRSVPGAGCEVLVQFPLDTTPIALRASA